MKEITDAKIWKRPPDDPGRTADCVFIEAEEEHHDYFARNRGLDTARSSWHRKSRSSASSSPTGLRRDAAE